MERSDIESLYQYMVRCAQHIPVQQPMVLAILSVKEVRMQRRLAGVLVAVLGLFAAAVPASAHHSFAAEFDANKCMDLTGTFTSFEWQNPHGYFHLDVKDSTGNVTTWTFETVSLSTLKRSGTERKDFTDNVGKIVTVRACLAKNGVKNRAAAETIKLSDGQVHRIGQDVEGKFSDNAKEGY
jgi:hypothetical protein